MSTIFGTFHLYTSQDGSWWILSNSFYDVYPRLTRRKLTDKEIDRFKSKGTTLPFCEKHNLRAVEIK